MLLKFPFKINPTSFDATENNMSYADFVIFKEHKFLRNIFSEQELPLAKSLKDIEQYHKKFQKFLKIAVYLQSSLDTIAVFF